jgi:hypothetical protein
MLWAQVVELLPRKFEALSSKPNTAKKPLKNNSNKLREKKKKNERKEKDALFSHIFWLFLSFSAFLIHSSNGICLFSFFCVGLFQGKQFFCLKSI